MPYDNPDAPNSYGQDPTGGGATPDAGQAQQDTGRESAYSQLRAAYKRYLKRDPSDAELEGHLNGRYDSVTVQRAVQAIQTSPEALQTATAGQTGQSGQAGQPGATAGGAGAGMTREQRDTLKWGDTGRMEGFQVGSDYGGDTKARNSVKNTFGRIASKYPATPQGLQQVLQDPEFKAAFPNAKFVEHPTGDKIDFGGVKSDFESGSPVGIVDVGKAFRGAEQGDEQTAWVWQPEGGTSASAYNNVQNAILNPNDPRLQGGVSGPSAADAILAGGGPDALAQYILQLQQAQQRYLQQFQPQGGMRPGGERDFGL